MTQTHRQKKIEQLFQELSLVDEMEHRSSRFDIQRFKSKIPIKPSLKIWLIKPNLQKLPQIKPDNSSRLRNELNQLDGWAKNPIYPQFSLVS